MRKMYWIILLIVFLIVVIVGFLKRSNVVIENEKIDVEIAKTPAEKGRGLMYRQELCKDCGMLFVFKEEGYHSFWMKNTLIPLDMIFINSNREIVDIIHAQPCEIDCQSYIPKEKAIYVLETNQGRFDESILGKKVEMSI